MKLSFATLAKYTTAGIAGYLILALELIGFRLIAPYFGYSIYATSSLIGLILIALSAGYWIGGKLGDRGMSERSFFLVLSFGGAYLYLAARYSISILEAFAGLPVPSGVSIVTAVLFGPSMVLLASVSPYLIKRLSDDGASGVGASAGSIYALSTAGSLLGTFLTSFFLIPTFGTHAVFVSHAVIAILFPLFWVLKGSWFFGLLALPIFFFPPHEKLPLSVIAKLDSPYNPLEVVDYGAFFGLRAERRSNGVESFLPKSRVWDYRSLLYSMFAAVPFLNDAKKILVLGLGTGTIALIHGESSDVHITGVELDPGVIALGNKYFDLGKRTNIDRIEIADARRFIAHDTDRYDIVEVDIYKGPEIPFYVATREFFALTRERLADHGILAMNIYDPSQEALRLTPLLYTIASVYPSTFYADAGNGSYFVLASATPIPLERLDEAAKDETLDPRLRTTMQKLSSRIQRVAPPGDYPVFTDDRAPIEKLNAAVYDRNRWQKNLQ